MKRKSLDLIHSLGTKAMDDAEKEINALKSKYKIKFAGIVGYQP